MKRFAKPLAAILLLLALSACGTVPAYPVLKRDATAGLIARPDFKAAAQAAPEWVRAAMRTITEYEAELSLK